MSDEQSNQPASKKKDLKARLGRTIAPNTPGAALPPGVTLPMPPGAPGVEAAPAAAPSADGGPAIPPPAIPAPSLPTGGNPLAAPLPGPKAVVEPPWVKEQREAEERKKIEDEKRRKRNAADPFAAAAPASVATAATQRVEIDETALHEALAAQGKKTLRLTAIIVVVVMLASIGVGKFLGATMAARENHNRALDAAENLHRTVQRGDAALTSVRTAVERLVAGAQIGPGKTPHVEYAAMEEMLRIENPFRAEHFTETNYSAFDPPATDALLKYYNTTRNVFERMDRIARSYNIRNPEGRAQLDASFQAANDFSRYPAACVPAIVGEGPAARAMCNMVFVDISATPTAEGLPTRARPTGAPTMRQAFNGTQAFPASYDKVFMLVNFQASADVMGSRLHLHDRYMREINELKALVDAATQARAEFRNEMDRIRHLPRQFTF